MRNSVLHPLTILASTNRPTDLEIGLVGVAAILLITLLAIRSKRTRDQVRRKAASVGYYDPDAARYGPGSGDGSPIGPSGDQRGLALAPSFVAPVRGARARGSTSATPPPPRAPTSVAPVRSSFSVLDRTPPRAVPSFDQATIAPVGPAGPAGPIPSPPSTPSSPATVQRSTLPPLEQPAPPAGRPAASRVPTRRPEELNQ